MIKPFPPIESKKKKQCINLLVLTVLCLANERLIGNTC